MTTTSESSASATVFRTTDPVAGEMLLEVLQRSGLDARLVGTRNGAAIGAAQHIFKLRIEVPLAEEERAAELVQAFGPTPVSPSVPPKQEVAAPRPRRAVLAGGASLWLPGGGHIYAHRGWTGLLLLGGFIAAIAVAAEETRALSSSGVVAVIAVILCDLVGGQLAVRAWNRGARTSVLQQLLTGVVLLSIAAFLGAAIGPRIPPPKPKYETYPIQTLHGLEVEGM